MASKVLSIGATVCDTAALGLSAAGTILEAVGLGAEGPVGLAEAIVTYNTVLNPIENVLSVASLAMTATSDVLSGNTYLGTSENALTGAPSTDLVLGPDTTFSIGSNILGDTGLTPEAATDTLVNSATVYNDCMSLADKEPFYGEYEFIISHQQGSDIFHGWTTGLSSYQAESNDKNENEDNK